MSESLIRNYYACFNERRFADAAKLFADDAVLEHIPLGQRQYGGEGYIRFANTWVSAFPDGTFEVQNIEPRRETLYEVDLLGTGTHRGALDMGVHLFAPTGVKASLRLRELLDIREGKIASSMLRLDLGDLIQQLVAVDYTDLIDKLECIKQLGDELSQAQSDAAQQRDIASRLGHALDAARKALRPHFSIGRGLSAWTIRW